MGSRAGIGDEEYGDSHGTALSRGKRPRVSALSRTGNPWAGRPDRKVL
jgi:hypothetical protein